MKLTRWVLLFVVAMFLMLAYVMFKGPDLSKYEKLIDPQISDKPDQQMLVVESIGDPTAKTKNAMKLLFGTYFNLKNNNKDFSLAPRARWPKPLETKRDLWIGKYALPVSFEAKLPEKTATLDATTKLYLSKWKYGPVVEILHKGTYSTEDVSIKKLHQFVKTNGYKIIGEHEEEYIKGPGMFGAGNPKDYYTVIRYRVEKVGAR